MRRFAIVVLALLVALPLGAAPVPKVMKDQWVLAINGHIYLFTAGDDKPTKLTDGDSRRDEPAWSADGKRIAFCDRADGYDQICVIDADGKNRVQLTSGEQTSSYPNWSPDGKTIAFSRSVAKSSDQICTINAKDGSELVIFGKSDGYCPVLAPNGKTYAFVTGREGADYMLYTMTADGKKAARLVDQRTYSPGTPPAWSPDGKRLAVTLKVDEGYELYLVDPDGSDLKALTKFGKQKMARCPSWSPDGKRLSFVLDDDAEGAKTPCALWVMDADGGNPKQILKLENPDSSFMPKAKWRPR